ncbi:TPA: elongation factor Tu [Streptococcus suis]|nr:elongation factor Tu [Streptococcus suis]HEL1565174.1 elongation factor Tu [Streptococcus suis]HEL2650509.1 elongation factor Tu [Streptococcus suis]HEL9629737.1 elongation factor Tu [Streptococcus suis]HEP1844411.1 elongation factor Tu [Streptococcus suis]
MDVNYLVANDDELTAYQAFLERHQQGLNDYIAFLRDRYVVQDLPQVMILANRRSATEIIRQSPVPAYTNDIRMVMTPDLAVWKKIYQHQLDSYENSPDLQTLSAHYKGLSENHLLQIIGHELAHWSDLFLDDFADYDANIWFEEGMVEYISRQYFLTEEEFAQERFCNQLLVDLFQEKHGWHSLDAFGKSTYEGDYASIFYEYWRSFLTIDQLVEKVGSVQALFETYHKWAQSDQSISLLNWFVQEELLEKEI